MKLTQEDKATLMSFGHREGDLRQLQEAANKCRYSDENGNRLYFHQVLERISRHEWLTGISRAAFHWSCGRGEIGKNYVSFDCSSLFR